MGVLGSLGFVPFVMHKFREDREGVARRFKGRQTNGKLCKGAQATTTAVYSNKGLLVK